MKGNTSKIAARVAPNAPIFIDKSMQNEGYAIYVGGDPLKVSETEDKIEVNVFPIDLPQRKKFVRGGLFIDFKRINKEVLTNPMTLVVHKGQFKEYPGGSWSNFRDIVEIHPANLIQGDSQFYESAYDQQMLPLKSENEALKNQIVASREQIKQAMALFREFSNLDIGEEARQRVLDIDQTLRGLNTVLQQPQQKKDENTQNQ